MPVSDRLTILIQHLLPKSHLTRLAGRLAGARGGKATLHAIRWFVRRYGVDMGDAADADIASYATFNEFSRGRSGRRRASYRPPISYLPSTGR